MSINPINMPTEETLIRIAAATEQIAKGSVFLPRLSVSAPVGVDITVTDGKTTLQKTSTETTTLFDIPNYGTWTVSYTADGEFKTATIEVNMVKIYPVLPTWMPTGTFAETSWADVVKAVNLDAVPDSWQLKDEKILTLKDGKTVDVEIVAKNREELVGGGTASLILGFADCLENKRMNSTDTNVGGWRDSELRAYCNGDLYNQFPDDLKGAIKKTIKKSSAGNQSTSIITTEDYLWLYSATEVFPSPSSSYSPGGEGELFPIFTDDSSRIKNLNGSPQYWWLRSPFVASDTHFCYVHTSGTINGDGAASTYGVVVGFAI